MESRPFTLFLLLSSSVLGCRHPDRPAENPRVDRYAILRDEMVRVQIAARGIENPEVLRAMRAVSRHLFVPPDLIEYAYEDAPLAIGFDQTISQPYIVALMTELLEPGKGQKILEVGTGSGYQAAVLAEIVDSVYTIEILAPLAAEAESRLRGLHYGKIVVREGDGFLGWPEHAPYDGIVVTAAAPEVPRPLIDQLKDGGRLVIPRGEAGEVQELLLLEKVNGKIVTHTEALVRFVPLVRGD